MRFLCALLLASVLLAGFATTGQAETAYIFGDEGWYAEGDTIQMLGDFNVGTVGGCDEWGDCQQEAGFVFRKVTGVNVYACTFESASSTCTAHPGACCFWMGRCPGYTQCDEEHCEEYEEECGYNCYCLSMWEVTGFEKTVGSNGCYELEFVCHGLGSCYTAQTSPCTQLLTP